MLQLEYRLDLAGTRLPIARGPVVDTIAFSASNPGTSPAAGNVTVAPGDSAVMRDFSQQAKARIEFLVRQGATEGYIEVRSPRFHDNTRGLHVITTETPMVRVLVPEVGQPIYPGDALTVTLSGGTAEVDGGVLGIYYDDIQGLGAKLYMDSDILPNVQNIKPLEVDTTTSATAMNWVDTVITTTENLLKADALYAIIGYEVDVAVAAVGVKGVQTGNLRIAGPGPTSTFATGDYFVQLSRRSGRPHIPVFKANDRSNTYVSASAVATSTAVKVMLNCVELVPSFSLS